MGNYTGSHVPIHRLHYLWYRERSLRSKVAFRDQQSSLHRPRTCQWHPLQTIPVPAAWPGLAGDLRDISEVLLTK